MTFQDYWQNIGARTHVETHEERARLAWEASTHNAPNKWRVEEFDDCGQTKWDIEDSSGVSVCQGCFRNLLMAEEIVAAHNASLLASPK